MSNRFLPLKQTPDRPQKVGKTPVLHSGPFRSKSDPRDQSYEQKKKVCVYIHAHQPRAHIPIAHTHTALNYTKQAIWALLYNTIVPGACLFRMFGGFPGEKHDEDLEIRVVLVEYCWEMGGEVCRVGNTAVPERLFYLTK